MGDSKKGDGKEGDSKKGDGKKSDGKREKWMLRQEGQPLTTIERSSITPVTTPVTSDAASILICSYNWRETQSPAIHVPGGAAVWTGAALPKAIAPDTGRQYIDQDGAKVPKQPFETVFRALEVQNPEYRFDMIDVLVNRNSLRKLLDFCSDSSHDSFRIDLHTVRNTLIIERCERNAVEVISGSRRGGFGHNFERSFTTFQQGLEDSTSHHRVLEYKLGDLRVAVRFEVDASYGTSKEDNAQTKDLTGIPRREDLTQLSNDLSSLQLTPSKNSARQRKSPSVVVSQCGSGTSQAQTAEIKTGKKSMRRVLPQMWFGRTPYLISGFHSHGTFRKVDIKHMDKELMQWEKDEKNQQALRKLAALLEMLRGITTDSRDRALILIFRKETPDKLEVFHRKSKKLPLPDGVIAQFWGAK